MDRTDPPVHAFSETSDGSCGGHLLTRDQRRALLAYKVVAEVPVPERATYKTAVQNLGVNILRNGLCAALDATKRLRPGGERLLRHLAEGELPGFERIEGPEFPAQARELGIDAYMLATRETLHAAVWIKRAAQATFGDDPDA